MKQQTKLKTILFCAAIFLTTLMSMQDSAIIPVADALFQAFPGKDFAINFAITGPSIIFFFSSLIAPFFCKFMSKKNVLIITSIVFTASCFVGMASSSLGMLVLIRVIAGLCCGFQMVISVDLITQYFEDENVRATVIGLFNASQAAVGAIVGIVAGALAVNGWPHIFDVYWVNILMTILVILFVPSNGIEEQTVEETADKAEKADGRLGASFWRSILNFTVFIIAYGPMYFMASLYIAENNLGNEAYAGFATSLGTIGCATMCLIFGFFYKKLKFRTSLIAYVILAAGLFICYLLPNSTLFMVISLIGGMAYGTQITYQFTNVSLIVKAQNTTKAISYINALTALGIFLCSYVLTTIMSVTGTATKSFPIYGVLAVALLIFEVFTTRNMKQI